MKNKIKVYRHGEIAFIEIAKLPEGPVKSESKVIIEGSHKNSHSINQGEIYFKKVNDFVFGYLVAKNTKLLHPEHGKIIKGQELRESSIPNGVYELRKQQEFINSEMKPVID